VHFVPKTLNMSNLISSFISSCKYGFIPIYSDVFLWNELKHTSRYAFLRPYKYKPVYTWYQVCKYSSDRKHKNIVRVKALKVQSLTSNNDKNPSQKPFFFRQKEEDDNMNKQLEAVEYIASELTNDRSSRYAREEVNARLMISKAKQIRFKTIENKYFKKEKSLNLLTWRAKEQMKYLHNRNKDPWSIYDLCDNFPICKESIVKVLKSRVRLNRPEDIELHDEIVKANWVHVRDMLKEDKESLSESLLAGLYDIDHQCLVSNADGLINQPFPKKKNFFKKGVFSMIVSDCTTPRTKPELQTNNEFPLKKVLDDILVFVSEEQKETDLLRHSGKGQAYFLQKRQLNQDIDNKCDMVTQNDGQMNSKYENRKKYNKYGTLYQKGNSMYNENGEFLFSIP